MAGVEEKKSRTSAKRKFTRAYNRLTETINNEGEWVIIEEKYCNIKLLWDNVQSRHEDYLFAAFPDQDEPFSDIDEEWLKEIEEKFEIVQKRTYDYERFYKNKEVEITKCETEKIIVSQLQKDTRLAEQKMEIKRNMFLREVENIERVIEEDDKGYLKIQIDTSLKDVKHRFEKYNDAHLTYLTACDGKVTQQKQTWVNELYEKYEDVNKKCLNYFERISELEAERGKISCVRLERMKLPSFGGDIRNYARFKSDFKRQVEPHTRVEDLAYTLKSCLNGEALRVIESVDDKFKEMWNRLDDKFGRPSLLVDVIMNDIKKMRRVRDGDNKSLLHLVDIVERGYSSLSRLKIEKEMSNAITLSIIEERLPGNVRREWSKEVNKEGSKVDRFNKFPSFMNFLLEQRRILEYEMATLRIDNEDDTAEIYYTANIQSNRGSRCIFHNSNGHLTEECRNYLAMQSQERINLIKGKNACWSCLKCGHSLNDCRYKKTCKVDNCDMFHHASLHVSNVKGVTYHNNLIDDKISNISLSACLLQIMKIPSVGQDLTVLWDSGASVSLITFKAAKQLALKGKGMNLSVLKVGGEVERLSSFKYVLPLTDKHGNIININVYGIDKISNSVNSIDNGEICREFPEVKREGIQIISGEIDVLVGFNYATLHPVKEKCVRNLLLMKNRFGRCIAGSCISINKKENILVHDAVVNHTIIKENDFLNIEAMGVRCMPICGSCKCGRCSLGSKYCTIKEQKEQELIEKGLELKDDCWLATYPWIRDPKELPDNRCVALKILESTERRLLKNIEYATMYDNQIKDMIERKVAEKLTANELKEYRGPYYYLSHHEVLKAGSSTPFRIVFNSSFKYHGHNLNDYWAKGPSLLNNLIGILLRFRERKIAMTGDIKKMYHSIKLSKLDQHTHRFLWRDCEVKRKPDTYIMKSVSFGDKPAGNIAITALNKTAELSRSYFPEAVDIIQNNTYMDDIIDSFDDLSHANKIAVQINSIIKKGNFVVKKWTISTKDTPSNEKEPIRGFSEASRQHVLGLVWDRSVDVLRYNIRLNFSMKRRGIFTGPDVESNEVLQSLPRKLTKRIALSKINSIYDPLGLITPFTIKAKMLLKNLWKRGFGWDEDIDGPERELLIEFLISMFRLENIYFNRSVKPENAIGNPVLITFSDASNEAFGACSYFQWEVKGGLFESILVASKSRVSPLKSLSIVRLELCAAVLGVRLANLIKEEVRFEISKEIFIVDSQVVRSMIKRHSYGFKTFVAVRIGEIQDTSDTDSWYWVNGCNNIADWITRGKNPEELHEKSIWQIGPEFMKTHINLWQIERTIFEGPLPEESKVVDISLIQQLDNVASKMKIGGYSKYIKLIQVTARVLQVFQSLPKPSLKNIFKSPLADAFVRAEMFWVKDAQQLLIGGLEGGDYARLCPKKNVDGMYVVSGRTEDWFKNTYNTDGLILLPYNHRFSYLYALWIHNSDHLGISATVCKIRNRFWIIQITRMVKSIRNKCVICRKLNKQFEEQIMGQLPYDRLKPAPAFHITFLDLFGPFMVRGVVNKRSRSKCFGVIFTCGNSRAVYCDLSQDYGTDSFLQTMRRFTSLRGYPAKIYSDSGTQLVAANKELKGMCVRLDEHQLQQFGVEKGLLWHFASPNAPWKNGCAESLIKSIKKAIQIAVGEQVLSFPELQTVLFEAANIVNERPIGVRNRSIEDGNCLCPNDLLLGRASSRVPSGPFRPYTNPRKRFSFIQALIDTFWKRWTRDFFPSLLIRQKWHCRKRELCVGDIVLMKDLNALRGNWKLGKISKTHKSHDSIIRNVDVQYKAKLDNKLTTVRRPVQSLVVLLPIEDDGTS